MKMVKNAGQAWRWFSMWSMGLSGALSASWLAVPSDMRSAVPDEWLATAALALAVLGAIGRMVDQGGDDA